MARGWESKSVEQQIEDARASPNEPRSVNSAPQEIELRQKREGLRLQRTRILQEMDAARSTRYREMLGQMFAHVEDELSSL